MAERRELRKRFTPRWTSLTSSCRQGFQSRNHWTHRCTGPNGKLESLDFVTLIMEVEEKINAEFGTDITIADENLLSKQKSPFSSLRTLIEYLEEVLKQEGVA